MTLATDLRRWFEAMILNFCADEPQLNTKCMKALNVTFQELREIVQNNDKQRFSMILASTIDAAESSTSDEPIDQEQQQALPESEDPSDYLIRANQGHSIKVETDGLLVPITTDAGNVPEVVVHGTNEAAWLLILNSGGLRRMGRNHIHFASGLPAGFTSLNSSATSTEAKDALPIISGMRKNSSVLVYIDIQAALIAGISFFISDNGVILTPGNEQGFLPYEFFKRVESRKGEGSVLMTEGQLPDGVVVDVEAWEKEIGEAKGKGRGGGRGGKARAVDDSRDVMAEVLEQDHGDAQG